MNQNSLTKIAVIDIDGTLIDGQIQQKLINFLYRKKELNLWFMLYLNIWFILYKLRLVSDMKKFFEYGLSYLKGKTLTSIDLIILEYINKDLKSDIYSKSFELVDDLKKSGYKLLILSTAVDAVISKVAKLFNIDDYICTKLEIKDGKYTGKIDGEIVYGKNKVRFLKEYFDSNTYLLKNAIAYADHESDIPMLKTVNKAYIVNPNVYMKHVAQKEGIGIINTK
ncbi:MAG: HAD-IB family hydrolase [Candidatus Paceibacterota bacterium]|jgi:HAD superfamily hydrolase (TIGR01490 family)